jgi:hypothetical protein
MREEGGPGSADRERLPVELAEAAGKFLRRDDGSDDRERDLLRAFGPSAVGSPSHRRAVCLCLNAIRRGLDRWGMPACGPTAALVPALERVREWVETADEPATSLRESFCHLDATPQGAGTRTEEGDHAAAVFRAVSALASFALFAGVWDGVEVLASSSCADGEEARAACGEIGFDEWLAGSAVAAAHELRLLSSAELNPGRRTLPRSEV